MDTLLKQKLVQIGLTEYEATIYTLLLERGSATAQKIYTATGINRVTTYNVLENLTKKGLVSSLDMEKKKVFIPEHPDHLIDFLENKKKNLEDEKQDLANSQVKLKDFLPELGLIFQSIGDKPKARFLEGVEGIKIMRETMLQSSLQSSKAVYEVFNEEMTKDLDKRIGIDVGHKNKVLEKLMKENSGSVAIYTTSNVDGKLSSENYPANVSLHYVDPKKFPILCELVIHEDKVAIITKNMNGILIENKEVGQTLRSLFELALGCINTNKKGE